MKEVVEVLTRDGLSLSATWFIPDNPHEKVVLINSATGVKQQYYADFACWLATQGFNVYTYDYRGIGESRPERLDDLLCDMNDWSKDVDAMISYITRTHPLSRLVILGHSVGGQLLGMSRLSRQADALVMIGSQTPYWKNYKGFWMQAKLWFFWNVTIPVTTKLVGYFPASALGLFEDLPAERRSLVDDCDREAVLRSLRSCSESSRAAADHENVVACWSHLRPRLEVGARGV